ncbi:MULTISPECIES: PepSY domain-containing protein [unclassified Streptomyces]|uniref:PepSY domain-containing protein n=1 Tax=unclassified Streptomyces TaxID=2593676 RepID=UPI000DAD0FC5|nr:MULTISPECIES: PepSY domain-containing protein [unclassified Streptomyces]MYU33594.1 peptidase M4 [Streptomyces sp. SID8358]MYX75477.1 peptidase M4 [Streptomyces sp. SID3915]
MKRTIAISAVTAAVLVGGGVATAVAFADDDGGKGRDQVTRSADRAEQSRATGGRVTLDEALAAALKSVPGTVTEAELDDDDDDGGRTVWELDVYGTDKAWHDVTVDAGSAKVLSARDDDDNDARDRHAPRSAAVSLKAAVDAATGAHPGTVTSVDLDDDEDGPLRWEVDVTGEDGARYDLDVDARTGEVTVDRDDD